MASPGALCGNSSKGSKGLRADSNGSRGSLDQALPSPLPALSLHHKGRANDPCAYLIKSGIAQTKTESLTLDEGFFFIACRPETRIVLRKRGKIEIKTVRLFGAFGHRLHMFLQANSLGIGGSTCAFCLHFGSCGGIQGIQGTSLTGKWEITRPMPPGIAGRPKQETDGTNGRHQTGDASFGRGEALQAASSNDACSGR